MYPSYLTFLSLVKTPQFSFMENGDKGKGTLNGGETRGLKK